MNRWIEVVVEVPRDDAESWADACLEAGALSVQAEDADADSPDEQPQFGEPSPTDGLAPMPPPVFGWQRTRLTLLLDAAGNDAGGNDTITDGGAADGGTAADGAAGGRSHAVLVAAAQALERRPPAVIAHQIVEDRDWVRATQAQFDPIPIGDRLIIVPSWHREAVAARGDDRLALIIDPGLAFGTGGHPTTCLCLEWLGQADLAGRRVIDYGCGSGILAIAAARLGAAAVQGIDIDPQALVSTRENARENGVTIDVEASGQARPKPADIVVANILSNPLKLLAPMLGALVAPGGWLVLAGVLDRQAEDVAGCYDPALGMHVWRTRDGWSCLVGHRPV